MKAAHHLLYMKVIVRCLPLQSYSHQFLTFTTYQSRLLPDYLGFLLFLEIEHAIEDTRPLTHCYLRIQKAQKHNWGIRELLSHEF